MAGHGKREAGIGQETIDCVCQWGFCHRRTLI